MDINEIADRLALQELANRYTDAILRVDRENLQSCWSESGVWHIMGQRFEGRNAIADFYQALTEGAVHVRHVAHSPILRLNNDSAEGRWQVTETVCGKDGAGSVILGVYDDTYTKRNGEWLFAERKLDIVYHGPVAFEVDKFVPLSLTDHRF